MKTELRMRAHHYTAGEPIVELWFNGCLVGMIYGLDGAPGIKAVTKHEFFPPVGRYDMLSQLNVQIHLPAKKTE